MIYWDKRLKKQQDALYDKSLSEIEIKLAESYKVALKSIKVEMADLYLDILSGKSTTEIGVNDLYQFNRFYEMRAKIYNELKKLNDIEEDIYNSKFEEMYKSTSKIISGQKEFEIINRNFITIREEQIKSVINSVWCADGKHWSTRIWGNKQKLQERIERGLIDCVSRGLNKDELVKSLMKNFDVGFNEANRIARTELTFVQNQSAKDTYKSAGITQYKYLAYVDDRTAQVCKDINNKTYNFASAEVGVNFPPMHTNCRCTIVAVL